jgi:hypothetical protein
MSKRTTVSPRTTRTRTGPKLRPRYCTFCGTKCEGARQAQRHCRKVGVGKGKGNKRDEDK